MVNIPYKHGRVQPLTRANVWLRDKCKCQYCDTKLEYSDMHWDHVIPRTQGGRTTWENIVTACFDCNVIKKRGRTPEQAGMKLLKKPVAPKYTLTKQQEVLLRVRSLKKLPHKSWARWVYDNVPLDEY